MISRALLLLFFTAALHAAEPGAEPAWTQTRALEQFSGLLRRSPFSLPTLEESAPLAERFALTGAISLDGENQIFVLDRTTLKRERVGSQAGASGLQLVEFLPDPDPRKMRAVIRLGEQSATIAVAATAAAPPSSPVGDSAKPGPAAVVPPAAEPAKKPVRLVIRKSKISGTPAPAQ